MGFAISDDILYPVYIMYIYMKYFIVYYCHVFIYGASSGFFKK